MSCFTFICPKSVQDSSRKSTQKQVPQGHYQSSILSTKPVHEIELDNKKSVVGELNKSTSSNIHHSKSSTAHHQDHQIEEEKQQNCLSSQETSHNDSSLQNIGGDESATDLTASNKLAKKSVTDNSVKKSITNNSAKNSFANRSFKSSFVAESDPYLSMFKIEGEALPMSVEAEKNLAYFNYLERLETDFSDWKQKTNKPFVKIFLRFGTEYHPDLPAVIAFCNLELDANPEDFVHALYEIEARKKWDKPSVLEFLELGKPATDVTNYYMLNKAPWPFSDRYFIEERTMRYRSNGDIEVLYKNLDSDYMPQGAAKSEKARTIIGGQIIRRRIDPVTNKPTLLITLINQTDMGGKIPAKALSTTLPSSLIKWYRTIKKVLEKYKTTGQI